MALKTEVVADWLKLADGQWDIVQAIEGGSRSLTVDDLYTLAESCEQAEIDDCSDLPYAIAGDLLPQGLVLWNGDLNKACRKEAGHEVYFINAYRQGFAAE